MKRSYFSIFRERRTQEFVVQFHRSGKTQALVKKKNNAPLLRLIDMEVNWKLKFYRGLYSEWNLLLKEGGICELGGMKINSTVGKTTEKHVEWVKNE